MGMLAKLLNNFNGKNKGNRDSRTGYILYKIVDKIPINNLFLLQCINTKAIFYSCLSEIVFDSDILYSLHPIQACYIGIAYAKSMNHANSFSFFGENKAFGKKINNHSVGRYGKYTILFQNRDKKICFLDKTNNEKFLMNPIDIALSQTLIQEFDATQSFFIGLLSGLKPNSITKKKDVLNKKQPSLKLTVIVNNKFNAY